MKKPKQIMADLFTACWKDDALKGRFMADPKGVLKEHGLSVPDGIDVKVVENADDCVHITLPKRPSDDLSDEDLEAAAGGGKHLLDDDDPESGHGLGFINSMAS